MKLSEIGRMLDAEFLHDKNSMNTEVLTVCGADLMSDVLRFTKFRTLLLTGLTNIQVVRTADISDLVGIVFVRGKKPTEDVIQLAQEKGIPLLITQYTLYEACGLLYSCGLDSCHEGECK